MPGDEKLRAAFSGVKEGSASNEVLRGTLCVEGPFLCPRLDDAMFENGLLLSGGEILTLDAEFPRGRALIVVDGRVVFVGDELDLEPLREVTKLEEGFRVVDLAGACVLPGAVGSFHDLRSDAHALDHPLLRGIEGADALVEHVQRRAREAGPGAWLLGREVPSSLATTVGLRDGLDRVAPRNPVCLLGADESWGIVNGLALRVARGEALGEEPTSGTLRSAHGTLSGIVRGPALHRIRRALPALSEERWNRLAENVLREWAARGWTAATDMGGCRVHATLGRYRAHKGRLPLRMRSTMRLSELAAAVQSGVRTSAGDATLRRGELVIDAADLETQSSSELHAVMRIALEAGIATCFVARDREHVTMALDLLMPHKGRARPLRHRIVAVGDLDPNDLRRAETLPVRIFFEVGAEGAISEVAIEGFERGTTVGFCVASSHPNPWQALAALRPIASPEEIYSAQWKAERQGTAWGGGLVLGTLREGAAADFVVLDRDPFEPGATPRVLATFSQGQFTFERPGWTKR